MVKLDQYLLVSASNLIEHPTPWKQGGIYSYDTISKRIVNLTIHINHKLNIHGMTAKKNSKSEWSVYAINHTPLRDEILIFDFINNGLVLKETITSEKIYQINDIEVFDNGHFIVTKDHYYKNKYMKLVENFARLGLSELLYYNGKSFSGLSPDFTFANGIIQVENNKVAVANMLKKQIHIFDIENLPNIKELEVINLDFFPDNLSYNQNINELVVSGHYKILTLKKHAENPQEHVSPSKVITVNLETKSKKTLLSQESSLYSGVSVAIKDDSKLYIGYIYQNYILDCQL
jgi:arylesterase/paraoxonase